MRRAEVYQRPDTLWSWRVLVTDDDASDETTTLVESALSFISYDDASEALLAFPELLADALNTVVVVAL